MIIQYDMIIQYNIHKGRGGVWENRSETRVSPQTASSRGLWERLSGRPSLQIRVFLCLRYVLESRTTVKQITSLPVRFNDPKRFCHRAADV